MDYTLSPQYATHVGTGHRLHQDDGAVPTVVSAKDVNQAIWSLMAVVEAAGMVGIQFDASTPASYERFLSALNALFVSPSELSTAVGSNSAKAKAWVTFNGNTAAITSSFNVTSVTKIVAGVYAVAFTPGVLANNEYALCGMCGKANGSTSATYGQDNYLAGDQNTATGVKTTTLTRIYCINKDTNTTEDAERISLIVFGD